MERLVPGCLIFCTVCRFISAFVKSTVLLFFFFKDEKEIVQARMTRMINGLEGMTYCTKRD